MGQKHLGTNNKAGKGEEVKNVELDQLEEILR